MSVLIETSLGDIVIDLEVKLCPELCKNFLKLCKIKYYNFSLFHNVQKNFMIQTGDPTGTGNGGQSIYGVIKGEKYKYIPAEFHPKLKHKEKGTVSMATVSSDNTGMAVCASQFFITTGENLDYLNNKHAVFGMVAEGLDVVEKINNAMCDDTGRPYRDIRIKHTIILDDPFDDPDGLVVPDKSPELSEELLKNSRIGEDEEIFPDLPPEELEKIQRKEEADARKLTLEMVGDLPFAEIKPPENVLFVCKLNPVTRDEDLELLFSRFGEIRSCEIVRDKQTNESLCFAFIEFENKEDCEEAYFKMDNVLIDDHRIHVDFSQSVSKLNQSWMLKDSNKEKLKKRTHYREGDNDENDKYDYVFEDEAEQLKSNSENKSRSENKHHHHEKRSHSSSRDKHRSKRKRTSDDSPSSSHHDNRENERVREKEKERERERSSYKHQSHRSSDSRYESYHKSSSKFYDSRSRDSHRNRSKDRHRK
ncbi:cyclophilin-like protein [Neocallimastix lanati (nom. inval.)]|jgi:peptidyl-prolyl cis-trans isomerase-like 4|uniref:Peptidyl-prolyl cis-trans isomerase n=1 Tax=Neocallimastix californiae TaxID=1754190 RepID=A0A1Y2E5X3_9FUNG|nr:cyclophilin-like protein [Neocallimastix sp. JGI-2020a]ORY66857.1 cyclophilin-like protein [Neocallimastix californiae]|eukprot:ORY66857.1 cyclophilin-like protein [Neocallimastix californiae]